MNTDDTEAPFLLALAFAKRGLDHPVSFKSFSENFRDYTLFGLLATFTMFAIRRMESGWEFFFVITPAIALPFIALTLFLRTFLIIKSLLDEVFVRTDAWWVSALASAALATSYGYVISKSLLYLSGK